MRFIRSFGIIIIIACAICFCRPALAWDTYVGKTIQATVDMLDEGNILIAKTEDGLIPVSFYGIGIPTGKQPFSEQAREALARTLQKGAKIILTTVNQNEEGIFSALVQHNDHSVNNMLVDRGLAWVDRQSCKAFFCRRWYIQEHLAVKERRGIWALNLSSPPWQWSN